MAGEGSDADSLFDPANHPTDSQKSNSIRFIYIICRFQNVETAVETCIEGRDESKNFRSGMFKFRFNENTGNRWKIYLPIKNLHLSGQRNKKNLCIHKKKVFVDKIMMPAKNAYP